MHGHPILVHSWDGRTWGELGWVHLGNLVTRRGQLTWYTLQRGDHLAILLLLVYLLCRVQGLWGVETRLWGRVHSRLGRVALK